LKTAAVFKTGFTGALDCTVLVGKLVCFPTVFGFAVAAEGCGFAFNTGLDGLDLAMGLEATFGWAGFADLLWVALDFPVAGAFFLATGLATVFGLAAIGFFTDFAFGKALPVVFDLVAALTAGFLEGAAFADLPFEAVALVDLEFLCVAITTCF